MFERAATENEVAAVNENVVHIVDKSQDLTEPQVQEVVPSVPVVVPRHMATDEDMGMLFCRKR